MPSPGDETAGAQRHARLRASAADREQVIEVLKAAFVQDRITKNELDQRVGKVLTSRTYDDLDALTADIPAGLTRAQRAEPPRPSDNSRKLIRRASAGFGGTVFVAAEAAALPHFPVVTALFLGAVPAMFVAGLLATLLTLIKWVLDRSSSRQFSPGPPSGARDHAARLPAPASPAAQAPADRSPPAARRRSGAKPSSPFAIARPSATAAAAITDDTRLIRTAPSLRLVRGTI